MLKAITEDPSSEIELSIAAPVPETMKEGYIGEFDGVRFSGFHELISPEEYDVNLESKLLDIAFDEQVDVIHIFGTEYPHTRAILEGIDNFGRALGLSKRRVLIGMQGVCAEIGVHYLDGIPEKVCQRKTLRDYLRSDGLEEQKHKFLLRAQNEQKALSFAGNITGRTPFDKKYTSVWAPKATYYAMNETLRPEFYEGEWVEEKARPHSIFLSQGNYSIKGMHIVLRMLPLLLEKYPDVTVRVAGDSITKHATLKEKLKLSGYGEYLLKHEEEVERAKRRATVANTDKAAEASGGATKAVENVGGAIAKAEEKVGGGKVIEYLGMLDAEGMKREYLNASLFICSSTIENSPNSLGEAMLLGVPCIAANVGGVPGMLDHEKEGLLYDALSPEELFKAIDRMWSDKELRNSLTAAAAKRARVTHDPKTNYERLKEIYREIYRK